MDTNFAPSKLTNKLTLIVGIVNSLGIPLMLYVAFGLLTDNFIIDDCVTTMRVLVVLNLLMWTSIGVVPSLLTQSKNSKGKKLKVKAGYVIKCLLCMFLGVVFLHVFIVLWGAALTEDVSETFHLSAVVTSASLWPCILVYGLRLDAWIAFLFAFDLPLTGTMGSLHLGSKGAWLGLWAGAIPIPLDWDRPWQRWPITCLVGSLLGHWVGSVVHVIASGIKLRKDKRSKLF